MLSKNNWHYVFSAVRRGGYSSAQIAEVLQVDHRVACELVWRATSVLHRRKEKKRRSIASMRLALL